MFCARCGQALAASPAIERRRLVTILFCDLVDSTKLGERLDAEILRRVQTRYFAAAAIALHRHGGQVEKFIGDAVMCVFGLPQAHEDDAVRACRAACDLLSDLDGLNRELQSEWGVSLEVRIGVNTGEVMAGDPTRGQALVTGDAVNSAARLEQAAGPGEVLIGELTARLARKWTQVEPRPPLSAKGKAEPLASFRLLATDSADTVHVEGRRGGLVGRRTEMQRLRAAFSATVSGQRSHLLVVTGEAGIGKSRLVGEFADEVSADARVLSGRCVPYGEGITYWPLGEIVQSLVGSDDEKLVALVAADPEPDWVASRVLRAVGRADGELTRDETFEAVARLLVALAEQTPVIAVVEDLHWAEPTLVELLRFLPERLEDVPLLVVGTARSELLEEHPDLEAAALALTPLDALAAESLLEDAGERDPANRMKLLAAAGGNPLFLHQLRAAAAEGGLVGLPPDLHALLGARLDRLGDGEREVLETAAVVGREFWPAALATLLEPDSVRTLRLKLAILTRSEFIAPGRADAPPVDGAPGGLSSVFGSEGRYSFRHSLLQDVAYRSMPKARAAELHERFAAFLESDEVEEERGGPQIAWHLEQAARLRSELRPGAAPPFVARRAAELLEEEGRQALAHDEPQAAASLLSRATALAPETTTSRAALQEALVRSRARPGGGGARGASGKLAQGDTLGGYEIEALAGEDGMGVVYRARDPQLQRAVAVKIISPELARDPGFRERFERESRIAAQIEHPNVIPVYRAGEDGGRLFMAMRYVDGTDLATVLNGGARLEPGRTARLLEQVAHALDAAHARGLVHRDLKPGNVLISGDQGAEHVYLNDFGLSLERDSRSGLTTVGRRAGASAYVAPEQIRGEPVDARTDVYALGGILFHCLTGGMPFPERTEFKMLAAHLDTPPPRPGASVVEALPFDAVVARAMAKDPADRYATAGDLGRAIQTAARGGRRAGDAVS